VDKVPGRTHAATENRLDVSGQLWSRRHGQLYTSKFY